MSAEVTVGVALLGIVTWGVWSCARDTYDEEDED